VAQEGQLPDLLEALRWRWKLAALVALAIFAGAVIYVETLPNEYTGEAIVAIAPKNGDISPDAVRITAPKYVAFVTAQSTIEEVAPQLDEEPDDIAGALDAQVASETGNITISVTLEGNRARERVADIANEFADAVVDEVELSDRLVTADIVAEAIEPDGPSGPPRRLLQAAALVVGVLLGIAISLLFERGRPRLRSWREIAALTGYPVLARVPRSRKLRSKPREAFADPAVGVAFRTMRTNLEAKLSEGKGSFLVVTSPSSGDGKTTIAALLAESLSRLGVEVLLLDADLRRPGVSKTFNMQASPGTAEVLRKTKTIDEVVQRGWIDGLSVVPTGGDPDAGDLLATNFSDILRQVRDRYEVVIADAPPLIGTDDAATLATMAGGIVLVVSSGSLGNTVNEAVLQLETLKAPVLGVVANRFRESRRAYYYG
jgi:capsular exopolysaccharide synthesis family protein